MRCWNRNLGIGLTIFLLAGTSPAFAQQTGPVTRETFERWMTELSNWGRWGEDDQLGTLNLITPEKRRAAAALVKKGVTVSLARVAEIEQALDNPTPFGRELFTAFIDSQSGELVPSPVPEDDMGWEALRSKGPIVGLANIWTVNFHGYAHTHLDSLCHFIHEGKLYNGFSQTTAGPGGASKLGISEFQKGIFTRGVLMDIPRSKGVDYLEPGTAVLAEDLEAWEEKAGVKVRAGDAVLLRTGRWARRDARGVWNVAEQAAGLHASTVKWLKERDVAVIGSDASLDVYPSSVEGVFDPVHQLVIVALGMLIFDNCDLRALSEESARSQRWEFLLSAAPVPVPGGTGSPLNPLAIF